jgi:hypothetical protein
MYIQTMLITITGQVINADSNGTHGLHDPRNLESLLCKFPNNPNFTSLYSDNDFL